MSDAVLDASAILAVLRGEPGHEAVLSRMAGALVSAVNHAEVVGKLAELGATEAAIDAALTTLGLEIVPFDSDLARAAGLLRPATRAHGLSLGDRACLALALATGRSVVTTDRVWAALDLGLEVHVVRGGAKA